MSNLSILQRNMLETMSEDAQVLYLRGCERDEWAACQMAWEWDRIDRTLTLRWPLASASTVWGMTPASASSSASASTAATSRRGGPPMPATDRCESGACLSRALSIIARLRAFERELEDRRLAAECDAELIQTHNEGDA